MEHRYALSLTWQGNRGLGTTGYRDYGRQVLLSCPGKPDLLGSADTPFRGDADRWNPEELLLAALSSCHLLSYLHAEASANCFIAASMNFPVTHVPQVVVER